MRTKAEVLKEHYPEGYADDQELFRLKYKFLEVEVPKPWIVTKSPYEAPEHPDIPSVDEIEKAMEENRLTQRYGHHDVCRIGNCVVKGGPQHTILLEAENLLFLQEHSKVRTPKVYAFFSVPKEPYDIHYLVTEFIEGEHIYGEKWDALDDEAREIICSKISEQFRLLRAVPSEGYYGRVYHQAFPSALSLCRIRESNSGPYDSYEDLVSAMYASAELRAADSVTINVADHHPHTLGLLSKFKPLLARATGYKPTLTHMDAGPVNYLVRSIKGVGGKVVDWEVVIIDWDSLVWLPAFVQAARMDPFSYAEGWEQVLQKIAGGFDDPFTEERDFIVHDLTFYEL
ncbi:uncharacterized protein BDZ99DRAFT_548128 [Mytilinidion resinicola]|uniref:Aminoglycoside phosphotransferase domain-containing protein n=1 Tax=Mytilinidion resinicola TaxID=574789 RepID=A0A6A6Y248_9PEZI|nr:uncharacterized protein BDZ99DRAFT_548128 [Mytilinidion resinicola]KAF2802891.1 hypothetical protein BDZ99DRAFT_548128 [Mytilinidion resinicola]